jgi:hypothetical protein
MLIRLASTAMAAGIVTTLLAASPIEAAPRASAGQRLAPPVADQPADEQPLTPRAQARKLPSHTIELPQDPATGARFWTGRLIVKFRDDLKFRADAMPGRPVRGSFAPGVQRVNALTESLGGSIRPYFAKSPSKLRSIELRAERFSKTTQPDLAGTVFVDVAPDRLLEAARAFNDLPEVEWISLEREPRPCGGDTNRAAQDGCGTNGPGDSSGFVNCYSTAQGGNADRCSPLGGGGGCNNAAACNADGGATPNCRYGCNDETCCELVSTYEPTCSDKESNQGWDAVCATYANMFCASTVYDTDAPIQGGGASLAIPFAAAVPALYKYDPCFALRAPPIRPPASNAPGDIQQILIQGSVFDIPNLEPVDPADPNPNVASQLLTYTLCDGTDPACPLGTVDPTTVERIPYNAGDPSQAPSPAAEGNPTSGVAFSAKADPSLENYQLSVGGDCLNVVGLRGCSFTPCCVAVCRVDPRCCTVEWDQGCVDRALSAPYSDATVNPLAPCVSGELSTASFPRGDTTPNFEGTVDPAATGSGGGARGYQLYTVGNAVLGQYEVLPGTVTSPPIAAPTVNSPDPTDPDALGGTLAFLNSNYRGGGLDMADYLAVSTELFGVGNVTMDEIRGQGIRVAVVDRSAFVLHEDLVNKVTAEAGQTQILISTSPPGYGLNPEHGTGVLGIIGAENNGFGVTGVSYASDILFFPAVSVEEGQRLQNAMVSALLALEEGDVLCIPMDLPGAQGNGLTIASNPAYFELISVATSAGITVVIPAGNEGSPVVTSPDVQQDAPDSGAIVVGACWPGTQVGFLTSQTTSPNGLPGNGWCRYRRSNFSNTESAGAGNNIDANRVHVAGWGTGCVTTGFGGLFQGFNDAPNTTPGGELQRNKLRTYSRPGDFTGTSPAAAMIAGWAACLQSFCLKAGRPPLPPRILRREMSRYPSLSDPGGSVNPQCGYGYTSPAQSGYPDPPGTPAVLGDTCTLGATECSVAPVGGFPRPRSTVGNILAETIGGSTPQVTVVSGVLQGGDSFSLVELDGAALNVGAVRRRAGNVGQAFGPALLYPLTGGTTDIQLQRTERTSPESISALRLDCSARISSSVPVIQLVYFYNFNESRWAIAGSALLTQAAPEAVAGFSPIGKLQDFIAPVAGGGCTFYARVYTCGLGQGGYNVLHDQAVFVPTFDIFNP